MYIFRRRYSEFMGKFFRSPGIEISQALSEFPFNNRLCTEDKKPSFDEKKPYQVFLDDFQIFFTTRSSFWVLLQTISQYTQ